MPKNRPRDQDMTMATAMETGSTLEGMAVADETILATEKPSRIPTIPPMADMT
jgi:hypothetical protein